MVCNVHYAPLDVLVTRRDHVCEVSLVYLHIHPKRSTKRRDLHVVTVCTSPGHLLHMTLEYPLNLFRGRWKVIRRCRICPCIFAFGISTDSAARVDVNKLFIVRSVLAHVGDHTSTDFSV